MRQSEHFNLFLAEGSDIVNPLVQDVPNYETIDAQMFKNQNAGVQNATELKNGTVHAITRNVPDAQFITFTATSNYTAGESFTVDGIQVTALTVGGETLPTGAYVINSQVLCVLKGTLLTVYGVGTEVADNSLALNGHPDTYFGTKEEVDNALDTANAAKELVNEVNNSLAINDFIITSNVGTFVSQGCCYYGKVAEINCIFKPTQNISNWNKIIYLPKEVAPRYFAHIPIMNQVYSHIGEFQLNPEGFIENAVPLTANVEYRFSITYLRS